MAEFDLRPMSTGELLDRTFRLYRDHFTLFTVLMALPATFEFGSSLLVQLVAGLGADDRRTETALMGALVNVGQLYVYGLAAGLTTIAAGSLCIGRRQSVNVIYAWLRMHVDSLTFLFFLFGVGMIGLTLAIAAVLVAAAMFPDAGGAQGQMIQAMALIVSFALAATGVLLLGVRYGVALPAMLFEDLGAAESLGRSARLTRGHRGRVLLILLSMTVIIYAAIIIFEVPVAVMGSLMWDAGHVPIWVSVLGALASTVGSVVSLPLPMIALTLLYYDIRIRTEGFDLQLMISDLRRPAPSAGTLSLHRGP